MANRHTKRVTLEDVAREAVVSVATASMALNNRPGINAETRRRVEEAAAHLGYAGVRRAPGRRIGVWMPDQSAADQYQAMLLRGVSLASAEAGYQTVYITTTLGRYREPVPVPDPRDLDIQGIIVPSGPSLGHLARLASFPGLTVLVDSHGLFPHCPSVDNDDEGGAYIATQHLTGLGHEVIGYVGGAAAHNTLTWRGFRRALAEAGRVIYPELTFDGSWSTQRGYRSATRMLEAPRRPTAVFCAADILAFGVIHAFQEHGLRVPEDVAVVSMDDVELAAHFNPPLTTVRVPIQEMGATAVRMLVGLLDGTWTEPTRIVLPDSLIVRRSCGAAAVPSLANTTGVSHAV
jgi:DNA-binding LacI/PurR family transcriptional regulator